MREDPAVSHRGREFLQELGGDAALLAYAAPRHWVVSSAELRVLGIGYSAAARRARGGWLFRIHRGVYGVGRPDLARPGWWRAGALAYGPSALLADRSASALHHLLPERGRIVHVCLPRAGVRSRDGIRARESLTLAAEDRTVVDGIPCTSIARTLVDLGDESTPRDVERAVDKAEILGVFDLKAIEAALDRAGPRRGAAVLRRVLREYATPMLTECELEERLLAIVRAVGTSGPEVGAWVTPPDGGPPLQVDFLWRRERLVIETDGRAVHAARRAFESDRLRDQRLALAGLRVVRFTWRQVVHEPRRVAFTVARLLGHRR